jgi:predicted CoA-substrate-specific enzyme activase
MASREFGETWSKELQKTWSRTVPSEEQYLLGIDVGSTTVKIVACPQNGHELLWHRYVRHESRQTETVLHELQAVERELCLHPGNTHSFVTGSGGSPLAEILGAKFVQEVTAVSLAVEVFYPLAGSVIELGGQDSKIIVFHESAHTGQRRKFASMNDKCAGGTGAVIEKIAAKLNMTPQELEKLQYDGVELHPVAGKCGVFAETDITGLQKQGVPPEQLMASLFEAIVLQNLSVLTRGHLLKPQVLLLGGPNFFLPGLRQAWRHHLRHLWIEQKISIPQGMSEQHCIETPGNATLFGALGAIEYGRTQEEDASVYRGSNALKHYLEGQEAKRCATRLPALAANGEKLHAFLARYATPALTERSFGKHVPVFLGIDGGSTTTKAVCLSPEGEVLASAYRISQTDPIADAITVCTELHQQFAAHGTEVEVLGAVTTGYSRELLQKAFHADEALVETVAHAKSALRVHRDIDAIIDVGGQDIKIILLQNGAVKDFRLNTQCSAGNGYFLQSTAESWGIAMEDFADIAFTAKQTPLFSYGCAVFLQSDIVNFQRQGWKPEEILAGLAEVLPKNIFLYVAGVSNVAKLGRRFLLQGGTQRNLAIVKAEIDFMHAHYFAKGEPEVFVHPYCGEAGAIGAALQAMEHFEPGRRSSFVGFGALDKIKYTITRSPRTRCSFCVNRCSRTFIEIADSSVDHQPTSKRIILANCDRGAAPDLSSAQQFNRMIQEVRKANPNIPAIAAHDAFQPQHPEPAAMPMRKWDRIQSKRRRSRTLEKRQNLRIGIPRVLNLYAYAPFFTAYLESLGVAAKNIIYSSITTQERFKSALGLAAIDPCFPSKVCISHIYDLLHKGERQGLDCIFFPMIDILTTPLLDCIGANSCPAGAATPEAVRAAFTLSRDIFDERGVVYLNPLVDLSSQEVLQWQMFLAWRDILALAWEENVAAVKAGRDALSRYDGSLRRRSREVLDQLEQDGRVGLVLLGRPYHHDPGLNQGILDSFQQLGYPIFSQTYLPLDEDLLDRLFGEEVRNGLISSPLSIDDVWKNSTSASTNQKLWAAKFAARHPNLIPVELSNFKCGHDAFISRVVEGIIQCEGKPHFCFRDLDENKPTAALRIRIETMHYFLKQYQKQLSPRNSKPGKFRTGCEVKAATGS